VALKCELVFTLPSPALRTSGVLAVSQSRMAVYGYFVAETLSAAVGEGARPGSPSSSPMWYAPGSHQAHIRMNVPSSNLSQERERKMSERDRAKFWNTTAWKFNKKLRR